MAFVDEDQRVLGQIFEQGRRRLARRAAGEIARIILDAGADFRSPPSSRCRSWVRCSRRCASSSLPSRVNSASRSFRSRFDLLDRLMKRRLRRDVVAVGIDLDGVERDRLFAGQRIDLVDRLELVAEQRETPGAVLVMRREKSRPCRRARETCRARSWCRCACIAARPAWRAGACDRRFAPLFQRHRHLGIGLDRTDAVDARHRRDDDHVAPLDDRARRRVAHAVDLLVDRVDSFSI